MSTRPVPEGLAERLAEAAGEELAALVDAHLAQLEAEQARIVLRNPFVTSRIIGLLATVPRLAASREIRREAVAHPATPRVLALEWVGSLYWPDLARIGRAVQFWRVRDPPGVVAARAGLKAVLTVVGAHDCPFKKKFSTAAAVIWPIVTQSLA